MQEKSVILTPNKRLARYLEWQFCKTIAEQNQSTWPSIKILPLKTWLTNCWQECPDTRILLKPFQEKLLWQQIITDNLDEKYIGLIKLAINAHEAINGWQLKTSKISQVTEDIAVFQRIYKKFKEACKIKNLVTVSELPNLLIPYIQKYNFETITFAGFDEYNPQLQLLITAIKNTGCRILEVDPNNCQNSIQKRLGFNNQNQELRTCALWTKKIIATSPNKTIGIVVPNLIELRAPIYRIFATILADDKNINISVGIPLNTIPIIKHAINFLSMSKRFSLIKLSNLLLSKYIIGSEKEKAERAALNSELRQTGHLQFNVSQIKSLAIKTAIEIPILINTLQQWQKIWKKIYNKHFDSSEWIKVFVEILQTFGWPGENTLTNLEAIARDSFLQTLQEFATTNLIINKISFKKALSMLNTLIINTNIQQESHKDAPINILGTLEATGINFDYIWIMGLDQENWPPRPKPNPFIPLTLQKKLSIPHASAERELQFCNTLINRYKRSAKEIIFSYTKQHEDRIIEPSPLIVDIPEISIANLELAETSTIEQKIYASKKLEILTQDPSPKLTQEEITHANSRLLEQQALCPFRAFMEFRLKTTEPKKPEPGISKSNRGIVIHNALEKIWQTVKTQQYLHTLDSDQYQKLIISSIEDSLNKISPTLPAALYKLEKQCLLTLLGCWLEIEKNRLPFTVIATEKTVKINLSSLPIKIRIDRIDQLADGNILLIDYKTGKNLPSIFDWFGDRPKNIQLPLYSLAINSTHGLALAQINTHTIKFKNISFAELAYGLSSASNEEKPKTNITWDELMIYWQKMLTKIVNDFTSGHALPAPITSQICQQCGFKPVCRIT